MSIKILLIIISALCVSIVVQSEYVYYPYAPLARYQSNMNITFVSGRTGYYQETAGFGSNGVYNGVLGITFERTENFAFLTTAIGKTIRKLNVRTTFVGEPLTRTFFLYFKWIYIISICIFLTTVFCWISFSCLALPHGTRGGQCESKHLRL
jgi:hypothetical protein